MPRAPQRCVLPLKLSIYMAILSLNYPMKYILKIVTEDVRTNEKREETVNRTQLKIDYYRNKIEYTELKESTAPVKVVLNDGSVITGVVSGENEENISIITEDYILRKIDCDLVVSREEEPERV